MPSTFDEVTAAQRKREKELIARDRQDAEAERRRLDAEKAIENGGIDFQAAVLGPTPEQMERADYTTFGIAMERQAAKGAKGYRRVVTPIPVRLHQSGKMTDAQLAACTWYRDTYEAAGLEGSIRTVDVGKEVFGGTGPGIPFSERQIEAQDEFRFVRAGMKTAWLKFFDAVVLGDIPVKRASRMAKSGRNPTHILRVMADQLDGCIAALKKKD